MQTVEHPALVQISRRQRAIHGDGAIVTLERFLRSPQSFQRVSPLNERLGVPGVERNHFLQASQRLGRFVEAQQGLALGQQQSDVRWVTGVRGGFLPGGLVLLGFVPGRAGGGFRVRIRLCFGRFRVGLAVGVIAGSDGRSLLRRLFQFAQTLFQLLDRAEKARAGQLGRIADGEM